MPPFGRFSRNTLLRRDRQYNDRNTIRQLNADYSPIETRLFSVRGSNVFPDQISSGVGRSGQNADRNTQQNAKDEAGKSVKEPASRRKALSGQVARPKQNIERALVPMSKQRHALSSIVNRAKHIHHRDEQADHAANYCSD